MSAPSSSADGVFETSLPFPLKRGKVRDVYDVDQVVPAHLLLVATDRVSAYDVVMPTPIPGKGRLLTEIARFWFGQFPDVQNHLADDEADRLQEVAGDLAPQSMLVRKLNVVPFECVARGYLAGSGWSEYRRTGQICGITVPSGLREGDRLPEPIFTPATKANEGHDENVPFERMADELGWQLAEDLRRRTLNLFSRASAHAAARGVLLADTKLEFGLDAAGEVVLADEIFTPDSSRYWPADDWQPGRAQPSFDKQFVRDYLSSLKWDRTPPGPALPREVVSGTIDRYRQAKQLLVGPPR